MNLAARDWKSSPTTARQLGFTCSTPGVRCTVSPAQTPHLDELQPEMRRTVNDHANTSWGVAVVGSAVILFATGVFCTSGLFYVYFVDTFCVSREAASWPASVMGVTLTCSASAIIQLGDSTMDQNRSS
ncbi:uncharacterized protein LOC125944275 [Dermacentor silvarum]|uniref:uncharacterized protein LOC125944275 n=1 Tax=Dermacentor silvarum TaxID=543639 RepID=UPI0021011CE2|nr:uncharacterized protein LOC125944275 [Dermacentor silvarum]